MKLLSTLLFLVSFTAHAALPSAVPSVTVSASGANTAQVSISPSMLSGTGVNGIFSLYASGTATGGGYFLIFYKNGVAYATGSSTKAYCFDITASDNVGLSTFQMVSSQASITNNSNTALTSGLYMSGASGTYNLVTGPTSQVAAVVPGVYTFGDGSHVTYAAIQVSGTNGYRVHMDCYEQ